MKLIVRCLFAAFSTFLSLHLCAAEHRKPNHRHSTERTTLASPALDYYDIKHVAFRLTLSDTSVFVIGDVTTTAQVTASSLTSYVFELDSSLTVDSVKINGSNSTVSRTGLLTTVTMPSAQSSGTYFSAEVFYHGLPPGGGGGFFNGITHTSSSHGTQMVYTVSDPYVALNWWPCKQSILDKIDSVDMYVSVPAGVVDGSNGVLVGVDSTSVPGRWNYHWQTHYPIDYYLISVAIARYAQDKSYLHFTGSTDSMLIHNFFIDTATFNPTYKIGFDSLKYYIDYFSTLYGRYPFWKEKYGVCYTNLPGGMEHQTMTTIGVPNTYIIAHELCHQWFGDHVTYSTWKDVWLSEGFATFSEQLYLNHFWGAAAALAHRATYLGYIFREPCGMISINDTTTADSLFDQFTVYAKAAGFIRMLQYIAPSDSVFFNVLQQYQQMYGFGNANTAQFKALVATAYGTNLDTFFNQWIYGRGYPLYKVSWDQVGSTVYVKLIQSTSCPSYTPHFNTPLELQLHSAAGDTILKVYNSLDTETYVFDWAPTMTNCYLNPDIWTICEQNGSIRHDASLGMRSGQLQHIKIFPNPTRQSWQITNAPEGMEMSLVDVTGRVLWKGTSTRGSNNIPGNQLVPGNYVLRLKAGDEEHSVNLVHW